MDSLSIREDPLLREAREAREGRYFSQERRRKAILSPDARRVAAQHNPGNERLFDERKLTRVMPCTHVCTSYGVLYLLILNVRRQILFTRSFSFLSRENAVLEMPCHAGFPLGFPRHQTI